MESYALYITALLGFGKNVGELGGWRRKSVIV